MSAEEAEIEQAETWEHGFIYIKSCVLFLMDADHGKGKSLQYIVATWEEKKENTIIRVIIFPDQMKEFTYVVKYLHVSS